jgi:hypothetical protein
MQTHLLKLVLLLAVPQRVTFSDGVESFSGILKLQTQHAIAISSSGAEFYALSDPSIQNFLIRSILADIGIGIQTPTQIFPAR